MINIYFAKANYLSTLMKNNGNFLTYSVPYTALPVLGSEGMISACNFWHPIDGANVCKKYRIQKKAGKYRPKNKFILNKNYISTFNTSLIAF